MIYQEIIFTKKECDTILNYKNNYESFLVTPKWSLLNDTRTVYHKENNFNGVNIEVGKDWVKTHNDYNHTI